MSAANKQNARRKVLVLGPLPPPYYGGSIFTAALVQGLLIRQYDIRHLNTQSSSTLSEVGVGGLRKLLSTIWQTMKGISIIFWFRPRLIYLPLPIQLGSFVRYSIFVHIAYITRVPSVVQFHDGQFDRMYSHYPVWGKRYVKFVLARTERIIVLSKLFIAMFQPVLKTEKIRVVHGSRDEDAFIKARKRLSPCHKKDDCVVVLFLSNLLRDKGYFDVVVAASIVLKSRQDVIFKFAGAWPSEEEEVSAKSFVRENGIVDRVQFLGPVTGEAKLDLLVSSDIFVFPSYYRFEAEPSVVIEAMAAELPIVATNWAALPEMVRDGVNGYIVPVSEPSLIADRIQVLADDPMLRKAMGRRGHEIFLKEYARERWIKGMCAVFDEVLYQSRESTIKPAS